MESWDIKPNVCTSHVPRHRNSENSEKNEVDQKRCYKGEEMPDS